MLKQIIIISTFLSFCFGQVTLTTSEANQYIKKINDLNNEIKQLKSSNNTLSKKGSNLGTTEESTDAMIVTILDLVKSYELLNNEIDKFEKYACKKLSVKVRKWDDAAKVVGMSTPPFSHYVPVLERVLITREK